MVKVKMHERRGYVYIKHFNISVTIALDMSLLYMYCRYAAALERTVYRHSESRGRDTSWRATRDPPPARRPIERTRFLPNSGRCTSASPLCS